MSEEPPNPFYMYDSAKEDYLKENLKRTMDEWRTYKKWADHVEEEIQYIQHKLREKHG